ncbi:hypothetical protein KV557_15440 [Kitasatospora aureofaciens]|uniref:hypothetical protein n=1 Tax=Kitasatospora aureofaciens TaxID=1894 RepID=UPI001C46CC7A|nr:hypothetical protein [Kitasatospora aureofaciens]MBV6698506.1 hypothetical protein [Kitasatospora aureofaciens]
MAKLTVLVILWVLRRVLPARGEHRSVPIRPERRETPVICGWHRPIPAHLLARTMPLDSLRLIPRYLVAWEETPADQKTAQLERHAKDRAAQWEKIQQRSRRAAAFAAQLDLPDPLHWLDNATDGHGVLTGRGA